MVGKRGRRFQFNFSNRFLYTFIAIAVVISLGVIVYAYTTDGSGVPSIMGHSIDEIEGVVASGISYTYYCFNNAVYGTPVCTDAGGSQGYCPAGYEQKVALGVWGFCYLWSNQYGGTDYSFLPPGGSCGSRILVSKGSAYICSQ